MILVTGATGNVGRSLLSRLRATSRDPRHAASLMTSLRRPDVPWAPTARNRRKTHRATARHVSLLGQHEHPSVPITVTESFAHAEGRHSSK
jgi:uncharacterized protein YbjT (DUF2867 family)